MGISGGGGGDVCVLINSYEKLVCPLFEQENVIMN